MCVAIPFIFIQDEWENRTDKRALSAKHWTKKEQDLFEYWKRTEGKE